jgi:hypothetical protein
MEIRFFCERENREACCNDTILKRGGRRSSQTIYPFLNALTQRKKILHRQMNTRKVEPSSKVIYDSVSTNVNSFVTVSEWRFAHPPVSR